MFHKQITFKEAAVLIMPGGKIRLNSPMCRERSSFGTHRYCHLSYNKETDRLRMTPERFNHRPDCFILAITGDIRIIFAKKFFKKYDIAIESMIGYFVFESAENIATVVMKRYKEQGN